MGLNDDALAAQAIQDQAVQLHAWLSLTIPALMDSLLQNRNKFPVQEFYQLYTSLAAIQSGTITIAYEDLSSIGPDVKGMHSQSTNAIVIGTLDPAVLIHELTHYMGGTEYDARYAENVLAPATAQPAAANLLQQVGSTFTQPATNPEATSPTRFGRPGVSQMQGLATTSSRRVFPYQVGAYPVQTTEEEALIPGPFGNIVAIWGICTSATSAIRVYAEEPEVGYNAAPMAVTFLPGIPRRLEFYTPRDANGNLVDNIKLRIYANAADVTAEFILEVEP